MAPIVVILLLGFVGALSLHKATQPPAPMVQLDHKKHKAARTSHPSKKPPARVVQKARPQAVPVQLATNVQQTDLAGSHQDGSFTPTLATNTPELAAQCQQPGIDEALKNSFRENSGLEPAHVNFRLVNPSYAMALSRHDNLDALFPCMAKIATDKGEQSFLFEFKKVGTVVLLTGQVPGQ